MLFAALWILLFAGCTGSTFVLGPNLLAFGIYPVPVAVCMARRRWKAAAALLAGCGLGCLFGLLAREAVVAFLAEKAPALALATQPLTAEALASAVVFYVMQGGVGLILGWGVRRRWRYGAIVACAVAGFFSISLVNDLLAWEEWQAQTDAQFDQFAQAMRKQAEEDPESYSTQLKALDWARENLSAMMFGLNFAATLAVTCVAVSLTGGLLRRWFGDPGLRGSFRGMRPPDWLVWVAILVFVLWYGDQKWPNAVLRIVAWNAGFGIAAIYWLNGLGVFLYGTHVLQPSLLLYVGLVLILANTGFAPVFCFVGLFDTWAGFRRRLDAFAAARRARSQDEDDGSG